MTCLLALRSRLVSSVLIALLLSLAAHGLLVLALWLWPRDQPSQRAFIDDTSVMLSLASPSLHAEPPEVLISGGHSDHEEDSEDGVFEPHFTPSLSAMGPQAPGNGQQAPVLSSQSAQGKAGQPADRSPGLLNVPTSATRVVYLLDRSLSMGLHDALTVGTQEVIASLRHLPAKTQFQVIAYNELADPLFQSSQGSFLEAEPTRVNQVANHLSHLTAAGDSCHLRALEQGLALRPDVVFLITDTDELTANEVQQVGRLNRAHTIIHTLELSPRPSGPHGLLARLAAENGGVYRCFSPAEQSSQAQHWRSSE